MEKSWKSIKVVRLEEDHKKGCKAATVAGDRLHFYRSPGA